MGVFNKLELPCIHLGPPTGELRDCAACGGKKSVPVFACAKYGRCSPGDRLVYREEGRNVEVQWCRTCPDYFNPNVPAPEPMPVLSGIAHPSLLDLDKMHIYRRNPDGSVPMETHFPGIMQTRPDGSVHWLSPPQQRPAMLTMMEARAMGLSPLGSGPGADPNCNGCSCGGVQTACCPNNLTPITLKATVSGTGSCNGTYTLTYNAVLGVAGIWVTSPFGTCSGTVALGVQCIPTTFAWDIFVGNTESSQTLTQVSCNPLSLNNTASGADPTFLNCCTSSGFISVSQ